MISIAVKEARSLREKVTGLIGKQNPAPLMIRTRFGIHTFGLKFPIDVLILNKNNKVVNMKKNLAPNRIFLWNPRYEKVLELPAGTIDRKKIKVKNILKFMV